jgi:hypothetical protein
MALRLLAALVFVLFGTISLRCEQSAARDKEFIVLKVPDGGEVVVSNTVTCGIIVPRPQFADSTVTTGTCPVESTFQLSNIGPPSEPYQQRAAAYLKQLVEGKRVRARIIADWDDSRYLRGLLYVDGHNVNEALLRAGLAQPKSHHSAFGDDDDADFNADAAQNIARTAKRGMWENDEGFDRFTGLTPGLNRLRHCFRNFWLLLPAHIPGVMDSPR